MGKFNKKAYIDIDIAPDGHSMSIEGHGYVGDECLQDIKEIEDLFGLENVKTEKKSEFYNTKVVVKNVQKN